MSEKTFKIVGNDMSDGYHTFDELYEHRIVLWIALCKRLQQEEPGLTWRSRLHSDGSAFDGWFVLGYQRVPGKQITYHLPIRRWDECRFAHTLDRAPEWDGHTPADALNRLAAL
jgi:hypothetical protein